MDKTNNRSMVTAGQTPLEESGNGQQIVSAPDDPRIMGIVQNFRVAVRAVQAHSAWVERQFGVSAAQLWALWETDRSPGLSVSEIARRLSIKPSTASNLLDKIEAKGLLRRSRQGPDQRVVQLFATEAGVQLLETAPLPAQGFLMDAATRMEEKQLNKLSQGLKALVDILHAKDEGSAMAPIPPGRA